MTIPTIRIHDLTTDEIIDREMNEEELAQFEAGLKIEAEKAAQAEADAEAKATLLDRLGITADEAKLLLS
jgi:hypothetical protein